MKEHKRKVLRDIGYVFTRSWIKRAGNKSYASFSRPAESCLRSLRKKRLFETISAFFVSLVIAVTFVHVRVLNTPLMELSLFLIVPLVLAIGAYMFARSTYGDGETMKKIARVWKPVRKKILRSGLVQKKFGPNMVLENNIRYAISKEITLLDSEIEDCITEGLNKKKRKLKKKREDLLSIYRELDLGKVTY